MAEHQVREVQCVVCAEPITNPICPTCLHEGVQQWLMEQGHSRLATEVRHLTRTLCAGDDTTRCIKCDNGMSLCAYCYTKEVFHLVERQPQLVPQYLTYFNFDLGHMGWERDARSYIDE